MADVTDDVTVTLLRAIFSPGAFVFTVSAICHTSSVKHHTQKMASRGRERIWQHIFNSSTAQLDNSRGSSVTCETITKVLDVHGGKLWVVSSTFELKIRTTVSLQLLILSFMFLEYYCVGVFNSKSCQLSTERCCITEKACFRASPEGSTAPPLRWQQVKLLIPSADPHSQDQSRADRHSSSLCCLDTAGLCVRACARARDCHDRECTCPCASQRFLSLQVNPRILMCVEEVHSG